MTKRESFIADVEKLTNELSVEGTEFFNTFKKSSAVSVKPKFTDNGRKILVYMQENKENVINMFKAKGVGEGLLISSRAASGSLRKLVTDGYVEKIGSEPVVYALTTLGEKTDTLEA